LKTDDMFPYADCPHCYWSGYFTSRSALKVKQKTKQQKKQQRNKQKKYIYKYI